MSTFLQLHLLTFYPPANLNRDDLGRPKSAVIGGATRLRISSQALKRAWRTSAVFEAALKEHRGQRTQRFGQELREHLIGRGVAAQAALSAARTVADVFGKLKPETDDNPAYTEQLAFIGPEERARAFELAEQVAAGTAFDPVRQQAELLRRADTAADIAMFGRMLADSPDFNREAAVQVAHAFTTERVAIEDDYYTAVDDLKKPSEDAGAGFVGEAGFGAGVFYLYVCVNNDLLSRNLGDDADLAGMARAALAEAAATIAPGGKQASFASRARAHYILAERGRAQPRTLAAAFLRPVNGTDGMEGSIAALTGLRDRMDAAYGTCADARCEMNVEAGAGSLAAIVEFCRAQA